MASASFLSRLHSHTSTAQTYEDQELQQKALSLIPYTRLLAESQDALDVAAELDSDPPDLKDTLAEALLLWFKTEFFSWVDQPPCWNCGSTNTSSIGVTAPSEQERKFGASRVEQFVCGGCKAVVAFPRYNDAGKLLETRKGRCGEWANVFTLCCRAVGLDARLVMDWTDHVWTEVYSEGKGRWVHFDPCEAIFDKPLLYESGWGKKLNYVIAFHQYGPTDVTRRYTAHWKDLLCKRQEISETELHNQLEKIKAECRVGLMKSVQDVLEVRDAAEQSELLSGGTNTPGEMLPGRKTGSSQWRAQRGEDGSTSTCDRPRELPPGTRFRKTAQCSNAGPQSGCTTSSGELVFLSGGAARASGEHTPSETCDRAFDGRIDTKWLDFNGVSETGSAWLEYCLLKGQASATVHRYSIVSGDDCPERDPEKWVLQGLPEKALTPQSWVTLDSRSDVIFSARRETLSFDLEATILPCRRFRLVVTQLRDSSNANSVQLSGFHLFEKRGIGCKDNNASVQSAFKQRLGEEFGKLLTSQTTVQDAVYLALKATISEFAGKLVISE